MAKLSFYPPAQVIKKIAHLVKSGSVLDIGAGKGRHAVYLAQKGFEVTALEPNKEYMEILNKRIAENALSIKTVKKDVLSYSPTHNFDVVAAVSVLHFLKNEKEVNEAIVKMKSWTKAGGLHAVNVMLHSEINNLKPHLFKKMS